MLWMLLWACGGSSEPPDTSPPLTHTTPTPTGDTGVWTTTGAPTGDTGTPPTSAYIRCPTGLGDVLAETTSACLIGRAVDGVEGFMGVPYAEPPVGPLRWQRPVAVAPAADPLEALEPGSVCIQSNGTLDGELKPGQGSEDCLFLNVLRPEGTAPGDDLPILFFIHGGGHSDGASTQAAYVGESFGRSLADQPATPEVTELARHAVVVTVNYRLAQLGWIGLPALSDESPDGASGNQGLWDALLAMRWVHDNAAQLGGDPNQLTVFGESAGSVMSCGLLASPEAAGLFSSVILQSGFCTLSDKALDDPGTSEESGYEQGARLVKALQCQGGTPADELACMRSRTAEEVMSKMQARLGFVGDGEGYVPVVDGALLPDAPLQLFASGAFNQVPVVVGVNEDEGTLFSALAPMPTEGLLNLALWGTALALDWKGQELVDLYDPKGYHNDSQEAWSAFLTDSVFICPARATAEAMAPHTEVRMYLFRRDSSLLPELGASHGFELPYVFGTALGGPVDQALSDRMVDGWVSVAAGAPTMAPVGAWPLFGGAAANGGTWLQLDESVEVITGVRKDNCDWYQSQGYVVP